MPEQEGSPEDGLGIDPARYQATLERRVGQLTTANLMLESACDQLSEENEELKKKLDELNAALGVKEVPVTKRTTKKKGK